MPKQITIDVPDGYEVYCVSNHTPDDKHPIVIHFKKKPPQFIEVREYLSKGRLHGLPYETRSITRFKEGDSCLTDKDLIAATECFPQFIRWIDPDWRRVEI